MKLSPLLALPLSLLPFILATPAPSGTYTEHLALRPLPSGALYAGFTFTATTPLPAYRAQHFRLFPRSLAQILQHAHTEELHLRFALGRWDDESWGPRPRGGNREGGAGVEIWAWVEGGGDGVVEERWSELVNSLSGLFCASLNFIDGTRTTRPVLTFEPEGTHHRRHRQSESEGEGGLVLMHGTLPHEVVCTENLTPFLKLLPCKGNAGISTLLDGHRLFDANWQTLSIDVRPICTPAPDGSGEEEDCEMEIQQTVDLVLDIERSTRPREDPIPRPRPIEEIECDTSKAYHGQDTCYPRPRAGEMGWSLAAIFGAAVRGNCHLSGGGDGDTRDVSLHLASPRPVQVLLNNENENENAATNPPSPPPAPLNANSSSSSPSTLQQHLYTLPSPPGQTFDLRLPPTTSPPTPENENAHPPLYATRHITGSGQEHGAMHATLRNPHPHAQRIVYFEALPWYLRGFMHTLVLSYTEGNDHEKEEGREKEGGRVLPVEKMFYLPAIDRQRGSQLELQFVVPARGAVALTYQFDKAVLRYTEYPPDANRGFDVAGAVIRVLTPSSAFSSSFAPQPHSSSTTNSGSNNSGSNNNLTTTPQAQHDYYLRTPPLLLPLPTPDFSMPYNVIILTSTVIALGFGSLFNLIVRRFVLVEEVPVSPLLGSLRGLGGRVRGRFGGVVGARFGGKGSGGGGGEGEDGGGDGRGGDDGGDGVVREAVGVGGGSMAAGRGPELDGDGDGDG
ncbi:hypothetical protein LTR08_004658 [Meristemomyces frigidus]|nr:hypothetical protein LTR08_004658 [Meristemomyces frigidus]